MARRLLLVTLVGGLVGLGTPAAHASIFTGSCVLNLTFTFTSRVRATTLTAPGYSIAVSPGVDLNPLTTAREPCAVSLDVLNPFRRTTAFASGGADVWTCDVTLGNGSWNQSWNPNPPPVSGSHVITGTWGAWTMVLHNQPSLTFTGTIHLTLQASEAPKTVQCPTSGITSLKMVGVMVFQDPSV